MKRYKKDFVTLFCVTPFCILTPVIFPLAIKALQTELSPSRFYDCIFTEQSFQLYDMSYTKGVDQALLLLYPYLLAIILGGVVKAFIDSYVAYLSNTLSLKVTAGLLDILFNKILVLSETAKQTNASGSLANLMFTDTFKI